MDFRTLLRSGGSDEAVADLFRRALAVKPEEHPFHEAIEAGTATGSDDGRGMYRIGG